MNGLTIAVLAVIIFCAHSGYKVGFLRSVYSLVSWVLVMAFVTWATPYMASYLEENTTLKQKIEKSCYQYIEEAAEKKLQEETEDKAENKLENRTEAKTAGIPVPDKILKNITENMSEETDSLLENMGVYQKIAETAAQFIIEGISFFLVLIIAGIAGVYLSSVLNIVSRLPVIHGINKTLGLISGGFKGIILVWIAFYVIAICATSEIGGDLISYIKESPLLLYLYENNLIMEAVTRFL